MNIKLKDTLVGDTIIVQVQPVLEQVQTVTTHFDIVGNLLWDNLFAPLLFGISIPLVTILFSALTRIATQHIFAP